MYNHMAATPSTSRLGQTDVPVLNAVVWPFFSFLYRALSLSLSLSLIYVIIFWSLRFGRTFSSTDLKAAFTLKVGQTIDEHKLLQELPGDEDSNVDGKRKRDDSGDSDASSGSRKGKKKKKKKR